MSWMAVKPKEFRFAIDLEEGGSLRAEDGTRLEVDPAWSPEHLLLAALVRCSLQSLRHHARRGHIEVSDTQGSARALFTKRESDERYAVTECEVELAVRLSPKPGGDELAELLARAEHGCFIGASLTAKPAYRWTVS
jgi:organic hydroperoxide reductase OsmC/OhrA